MINKSEVQQQLDFLTKDREQVQKRLDQASEEIHNLERTLNHLDGAIQVSNHYLSMINNKETDNKDNGEKTKTPKSEKKDKK